MSEENNSHKIDVDISGLKTGEKLEYTYDPHGRIKSVERKSATSSSCWIATAYYGDANHSCVNQLRDAREQMLRNFYSKPIMKILNRVYLFVGRTRFGVWWSINSSKDGDVSCVRYISGIICQSGLVIKRFIVKVIE